MAFSTLSFLFFFLPGVFILYFICPNRVWRNSVLLVFSLLFYSWGEPQLVLLMLLAAFVAYIGGFGIAHFEKTGHKNAKKAVFVITTALLVGNLLFFKYLNFFADNLTALFGVSRLIPEITLPIGISFYTFQILSYVIDLYRGEIALQKNFAYLTLYLSFFPQLIAGPIVRYQTVENEIRVRKETVQDVTIGLRRFAVGLAKKVILANTIGSVAASVYAGSTSVYGTAMYWIAALSYTLQIYFDFSGYSDMAIGLGAMFGFRFLENFNYPYLATSVTDFWRRWHISLSSWFRDYIYIPLGGNRVSRIKWIRNILIVWALTGFWHGAQWNFLLWGLYYGLLLLIEKLFLGKVLDKLPKVLRWAYTMLIVMIGWVIFDRTDFTQMRLCLRMLFAGVPTDFADVVATDSTILFGALFLPFGFLFSAPVLRHIRLPENAFGELIKNIGAILLMLLSTVFIVSSTYNPFIYFRF